MDVEIRRAGPGDAAALALIGQATFLESYAGQLPAENILAHCAHEHAAARYAAWLADADSQVWIAEAARGRAPVGYAVITAPDLPVATAAGDLELKRFYLLSRWHGRGVGAQLMARVAAGAREAGAGRLLLGVFTGNTRAIAFYARQGFAQAGARKFRVGEGVYDDLVLARSFGEGG
jgi:diamine N-acetyltransferase